MAKAVGAIFSGVNKVLKLIVIMDVQLCEYTKSHIVYFKWVDCMICELHLNENIKSLVSLEIKK